MTLPETMAHVSGDEAPARRVPGDTGRVIMFLCEISNGSSEEEAAIQIKLKEKEYDFLKKISDMLNEQGGRYAPYLSVIKIRDID